MEVPEEVVELAPEEVVVAEVGVFVGDVVVVSDVVVSEVVVGVDEEEVVVEEEVGVTESDVPVEGGGRLEDVWGGERDDAELEEEEDDAVLVGVVDVVDVDESEDVGTLDDWSVWVADAESDMGDDDKGRKQREARDRCAQGRHEGMEGRRDGRTERVSAAQASLGHAPRMTLCPLSSTPARLSRPGMAWQNIRGEGHDSPDDALDALDDSDMAHGGGKKRALAAQRGNKLLMAPPPSSHVCSPRPPSPSSR